MEEQAKTIAELLKLLANEHRLLILCALIKGELTVGDIHKYVPNITASAPVSYTHLDVYKRQHCDSNRTDGKLCSGQFFTISYLKCENIPVSYTHLDVYKRQPYNNALFNLFYQ